MRYLAIVSGLALACGGSGPYVEAVPDPPQVAPPVGTTVTFDEEDQNATSLEQMLVGRLAGVTVTRGRNGGIVVRMTGPTSFYAGQEPLFIVDGIPIAGSPNGELNWLSPRDVESITALKDPSQTAIYGVRGSNGVIVIKTKGSH